MHAKIAKGKNKPCFLNMQQLFHSAFIATVLPSSGLLTGLACRAISITSVRHLMKSSDRFSFPVCICVWFSLNIANAFVVVDWEPFIEWELYNTSVVMLMTLYCMHLIAVSPFLITDLFNDLQRLQSYQTIPL